MDGFIFYSSFLEATKDLDNEQFGAVMRAITEYGINGTVPESMDPITKIVFTLVRPQIDANTKRREDGAKGGRPSKQVPSESENHGLQNEKPVVSESENHGLADTKPKEKVKEKVKENVKENVKVKEKEKEKETYCAEPETSAPPVLQIPLNDGSLFPITKQQVEDWTALYPAVDVVQELRKMVGWCQGNPTRKKTRTGVLRFVTSWLSREQDRARSGTEAPQQKRTRFSNFDERPYDAEDDAIGTAWLGKGG